MNKLFFLLIASLLILSCHDESDELIPKACFDLYPKSEIETNDTIFFTNCSENYTSVIWDFGDGSVSTEISPKHIYYESGTFKILQTVKNNNQIDTLSEFITIKLKYLIIGQDSNKTIGNEIDKLIDPFEGVETYNFDLNSDNKTDIIFSVENQRLMAGLCLTMAEIKAETMHEDIELIVDSIYLGVLNYGDTLDTNSNWGKGSFLILRSNQNCEDWTEVFEGYWKDVSEKFIGFRLNEKRGWIKAGLKYNCSLQLYEYSIEK